MTGVDSLSNAALFYYDLSISGQSQVIFAPDSYGRLAIPVNSTITEAVSEFGLFWHYQYSSAFANAFCTNTDACGLSCVIDPAYGGNLDTFATCDGGQTISIIDGSQDISSCQPITLNVIDAGESIPTPTSVTFDRTGFSNLAPGEGEPRDTSTMAYLSNGIHIDHFSDNSIRVYNSSTTPWTLLATSASRYPTTDCGNPTDCTSVFQNDGNFVAYGPPGKPGWTAFSNGDTSMVLISESPYMVLLNGNSVQWSFPTTMPTPSAKSK